MKCKNYLCHHFKKEFEGNCNLWDEKDIGVCETKKKFDRRALLTGTIEIETEEIVQIEDAVAPWKCKCCDFINTIGTDICLKCNTNINEGKNNG